MTDTYATDQAICGHDGGTHAQRVPQIGEVWKFGDEPSEWLFRGGRPSAGNVVALTDGGAPWLAGRTGVLMASPLWSYVRSATAEERERNGLPPLSKPSRASAEAKNWIVRAIANHGVIVAWADRRGFGASSSAKPLRMTKAEADRVLLGCSDLYEAYELGTSGHVMLDDGPSAEAPKQETPRTELERAIRHEAKTPPAGVSDREWLATLLGWSEGPPQRVSAMTGVHWNHMAAKVRQLAEAARPGSKDAPVRRFNVDRYGRIR